MGEPKKDVRRCEGLKIVCAHDRSRSSYWGQGEGGEGEPSTTPGARKEEAKLPVMRVSKRANDSKSMLVIWPFMFFFPLLLSLGSCERKGGGGGR